MALVPIHAPTTYEWHWNDETYNPDLQECLQGHLDFGLEIDKDDDRRNDHQIQASSDLSFNQLNVWIRLVEGRWARSSAVGTKKGVTNGFNLSIDICLHRDVYGHIDGHKDVNLSLNIDDEVVDVDDDGLSMVGDTLVSCLALKVRARRPPVCWKGTYGIIAPSI